jgi:arylsulfatase
MATFIELGRAKYPNNIGDRTIDPLVGLSLVPILRGEKRTPHQNLYFHFGTDRALRTGDWKLVAAKGGKWELYNLEEDRTELNDLAAQEPERVARMKDIWFRTARDIDRLPERQLKPAKKGLSKLRFGK